jgi:CMP-N,N'-diacetyllegionaminic acid synthase
MKNLGKIIAHIPARGASARVPSKNLRLLADRPLLFYSTQAAIGSRRLNEVYVNTESEAIAAEAEKLGVSVYRRRAELAANDVQSDQFNMDFIGTLKPDTLVMINPVCPFVESDDIDRAIEEFQSSDADTLITVTETHLQCFYEDQPINVDVMKSLRATQDNSPISICNWAITIWDAASFAERYRHLGCAAFGEKRILFPLSSVKGIKISTESDFQHAELVMESLKRRKSEAVTNH